MSPQSHPKKSKFLNILLVPIFGLICAIIGLALWSTVNAPEENLITSRPSPLPPVKIKTVEHQSKKSTPSAPNKTGKPLSKERRKEKNTPINSSLARLLGNSEIVAEKITPTNQDGSSWIESKLLKSEFKYSNLRLDQEWEESDQDEKRLITQRVFVADHVMVRFPKEMNFEDIKSWAAEHNLTLRSKLRTTSVHLLATQDATLYSTELLFAALKSDFGDRAIIEHDFIVFTCNTPDDSSYSDLWGLHNTGQTGGTTDADIDAPEAWTFSTGSRDILVGIIDTGFDYSHPDLAANAWSNPGEIANNGIDDDGNGFIDDTKGWDFYANDNDPMDTNGHGTHCGGTIGAVGDNATGVVGVNWEVSLVGIQFLGPSGGGATSDAIDAVNYGTTIGTDLTSNSWGGGAYSALLEQAIQDAADSDILFVAAAGNDSFDSDSYSNYPSGYDVDTIISVASTTDTDDLSYFSNYGATTVDLGAPGSDILSTVPGAAYDTYSGTSMATPHVSGALALLKAMAPNLDALSLKNHLLDHVDPISSLAGITVTGGRLNLANAALPLSGPLIKPQNSLVEVTSGNGDDFVNPGEELDLVISLANVGSEAASGLATTLTVNSTTSDVTIVTASFPLPDLAAGASSSALRFPIRLASTIQTPTQYTFTLTVTDDSSNSWTSEHELGVYTSSSVSGTVTSLADNSAITNALVEWNGPVSGSMNVDSNGQYSFDTIDGSYTITVSAPGFVPSEPQTASTPPSITNLDFALGIPDLYVDPLSITTSIFAGSTSQTTVTFENRGNVPLDWTASISASPESSSIFSVSETTPSPQNTQDLLGKSIAMIDSYASSIRTDLINRGATVADLYLPLTAGSLDAYDCLFLGEDFYYTSTADITIIRTWLEEGGSIFIDSDDSTTSVNTLLQGTGIQQIYQGYYTFIANAEGTHPIVEDVSTVSVLSAGAYFTISDNTSVPLLLNINAAPGDNNYLAVATEIGSGRIVALGNELDASIDQGSDDDGRLFANQAVSWLTNTSRLTSLPVSNGVLNPGETYDLAIDIDASNQLAGLFTGNLIINTNEPGNPTTTIPISITIIGAPGITIEPSSLEFSDTFVNGVSELDLEISNTGTDDLIISSLTFGNASFSTTASAPITISPRDSTIVPISFAPLSDATFNSNLTVGSNSSADPSFNVSLSGNGVLGPEAEVNPSSFTVSLPYLSDSSETLAISNTGDTFLDWELRVADEEVSVSDSFDSLREELNLNGSEIAALIPNRYDFIGGETGTSISDGGGDMYDGGNFLSLDGLSSYLNYTNGSLSTYTSNGVTNRYFTSKVPGLFVFAAELDGASQFDISGNLGADGGGSTDSSTISIGSWKGYIKRVYAAGDPSVNHLIIVRDDPNISQVTPTTTSFDEHTLSGLDGQTELYYLLFASSNGGYIDDADMLIIMEAFLDKVGSSLPWLSFEPSSGTIPAAQDGEIELLFTTEGLLPDTYDAVLELNSNDASDPVIEIPVSLEVTPAPVLAVSHESIAFPDTPVDTSSQVLLTITNEGVQTLEVSSLAFTGASTFAISDSGPISIVPGASSSVQILFAPTTGTSELGTLTLTSNDLVNPSLSISLTGNGTAGSGLTVNPTDINFTLASGAQGSLALNLNNTNAGSASFESDLEQVEQDNLSALGLDGAQFAIIETYDNYHVDLVNYLTTLTGVTPTFVPLYSFTASDLEEVDVAIVDGSIESIGATQRAILQSWLADTGALMIQSNSSLTSDSNALLANYGISLSSSYSYSPTLYSTGDHSVVQDVTSFGLTNTLYNRVISGSETIPILTTNTTTPESSIRGALDEIDGGSRIAVFTGYLTTSSLLSGGDSTTLLNNVFEWLAKGNLSWLSLEPEEGTVLGNNTLSASLLFDANDLFAGDYYANVNLEFPALNTSFQVPVHLTVTGEADIGIEESILQFASTYIGDTDIQSFTLLNQGTADLTVSSITLPHNDLAFSEPFIATLIPPGESITISVEYAPTSSESLSGNIEINSDDPDLAVLSLPITGSSNTAPSIVVSTNSINLNTQSGSSASTTFTIGNTGETDLEWTITSNQPNSTLSLEGTLSSLMTNSHALNNIVPNLEAFTEGNAGYCIVDGGNDMYNTGNCLRTDLTPVFGDSIAYSSGTILDGSEHFGPETNYFTLKLDQFFILSADLNGCDTFEFFGNTGIEYYDSGSVESSSQTFLHRGTTYRALIKRTHGSFTEPSVNHIIIVEEAVGINHTAPSDLNLDNHTITGLSSSTRLHSLVFGGTAGSEIAEDDILALARTYLNAASSSSDWTTTTPSSGTNSQNNQSTVTVMADATYLYAGTHEATLAIDSNDPSLPEIELPVTLIVSGQPEITIDPTSLIAEATSMGGSSTSPLHLINSGTAELTVNSISATGDFAIEQSQFPLVIEPGTSTSLEVIFSPTAIGLQSGILTVQSDATNSTSVDILAYGLGLTPPSLSLDQQSFAISIGASVSTTETLEITNNGNSNLHWQAAIDFSSLSANSSGVLDGLEVLILRYSYSNYYNYLTDMLVNQGAEVFDVSVQNFDSHMLSSVDVVILTDDLSTTDNYTDLSQWVSDGGALFIDSYNISDSSINTLLYGTGITLISGTYRSGTNIAVEYDNITLGLNSLQLYNNSIYDSFTLVSPALPLASWEDDATAVARSTLGDGRIAANSGILAQDSYFHSEDNSAFMLNIVRWLGELSNEWLTLDTNEGTVGINNSTNLLLDFSSHQLVPGTYEANLILFSDDPTAGETVVPISLEVTPAPEIVANPNSVNLEATELTFTNSETITLSNGGYGLLNISSLTTTGDYSATTDASLPVTLTPGDSIEVVVTFLPTSTGAHNETLTVTSDALTNPSLQIPLSGFGLGNAAIALSHNAFDITTSASTSATETLTISNSGSSPLRWSLSTSTEENPETIVYPPDFSNKTIGILAYSTYHSHLRTDLANYGATLVNLAPPLQPSLLETLDIIFIDDYYTLDAGNLAILHSWIQDGGTIFISSNSSSHAVNILSGTDIIANYAYRSSGAQMSISQEHAITDSVSPFTLNYSTRLDFTLSGDAISLLDYSDGDCACALASYGSGYIIATDESFVDSLPYWSQDGDRFFYQAFAWLAKKVSWLHSNRTAGTIPSNGESNITLSFIPEGLDFGTYTANLVIESNDPSHASIVIPVNFTVSESAFISPTVGALPDSLNFTLFENETSDGMFKISNLGISDLNWSATINDSLPANIDASQWFNIQNSSGVTSGMDDSDFAFDIDTSSLALGEYTGDLVLHFNDTATPTYTVPLTLEIISSSPLSSAYTVWRDINLGGDGVGTGFLEDFDNNGSSNGEEFFFATDILARDGLPEIIQENGLLKIRISHRSGLPVNWLRWSTSTDMLSWSTPHNMPASDLPQDNGDGTTTSEVMVPSSYEHFYLKPVLPSPE